MRIPGTRHLDNERGATLVFVAIAMVLLLSMAALAVDYGMLAAARAEAQRAADAGALAGASTYLDPLPSVEDAESRAETYATGNSMLGRFVRPEEVTVNVDEPNSTVHVEVSRTLPTLFARIFGVEEQDVGATASARVATTDRAACVKPFAIPNMIYSEDDYGTRQKIWEQKDDGDGFVLIGHDGSPPGLGNIRPMIAEPECEDRTLSAGSTPYRAPDDTRLGQVRNGFSDLIASDPDLTWTPDGPYDGFNREDYLSSPRVAVVPTYDPGLSDPVGPGTGTVHIDGFLLVYFQEMDRTPPPQPHDRVWGIVLRSTGISDVCELGTCVGGTQVLQLIR